MAHSEGETEKLFIRIYTDEHVTALLAPALRRRGYAAQSCVEANTLGLKDDEQLVYAVEHGMALMTSNASDFILLARRWYVDKREHAGIIVSPEFSRREMGTLLRWTLQLLDRLTSSELYNAVVYLQQFK
jgi:predicted nuclease of predicted toxin-antitoxin system